MQVDEQRSATPATTAGLVAATPLLHKLPLRRTRHAFTSIASLKASARAAMCAGSHSSATAQLSHLWPLADDLLRAHRLQINLEASNGHVSAQQRELASSSCGHPEHECMELGSQLPIQSELMGVPVEGQEDGVAMHVWDACTDNDDGDDVDAGEIVAAGSPVRTHAARAEELQPADLDICHTHATPGCGGRLGGSEARLGQHEDAERVSTMHDVSEGGGSSHLEQGEPVDGGADSAATSAGTRQRGVLLLRPCGHHLHICLLQM